MEEVSFQEYATTKQGPRFPKKLLFMLLFLLVLAGLGFMGYGILNSSQETTESITPTEAPIPTELPTETPTPSVDPSITPGKVTPTKATTITPTPSKAATGGSVDKATGLDRATLTVQVLNGSGTAGVAKAVADELSALGYKMAASDNAETFDYTDVEVQVKSTKSKYLPLLKKDLEAEHTVESATSDLSSSSEVDAVVIIGKE